MPSYTMICLLGLEKKKKMVFAIYSQGGHLGHVTWSIYANFFPPPKNAPQTVLTLIGQAVSEKKIMEIVDRRRRTDDGTWLSYKLTF